MKVKKICPQCNKISYLKLHKESRKLGHRVKKDFQKDGYCYFCDKYEVTCINEMLKYELISGKER